MRSLRVWLCAALALAACASLLAARGRQQAAAAQGESPEVFSSSKGEDELSAVGLPGDLDLTFGGDGTVITDLGNNRNESAYAVAAQADGKVVAAGSASTASAGNDFAVVRLNADGTPDSTFSDDGRLTFNFGSATRDDIGRAVVIQPDGKIVVAGEADISGFGNFDIALARLNADGSLDPTFGNNGKVSTNLPNNRADYGRAVALQPDGKILVAGYSNRPTTGDDFVAVRYNPNGSLDTSFDADGIVTTDILTNREDRASSLALQPDGRIVVAGHAHDPSFNYNFAVVRYHPNGALDAGFNGTGKITTDLNLNSDDKGAGVALQGDDKIVVAGSSSGDFGLVRYNTNGPLDVTFGGGDGIVTTNFGTGAVDTGRAVVVQSGGKITVAGRSRSELAFARYGADGTLDNSFDLDGLLVQNAGNNFISGFGGCWAMALQAGGKIVAAGDGWRDGFANDFAVSRLNANGTFDLSFDGGDGLAATDVNGRADGAGSIAIQPDGKIVLAGSAQNATGGYDFVVARYNTNGTPDTTFDGDGIAVTDIGGHPDEGAFGVALQPDGKILVAGRTDNVADGNVDDGALIRYNSNGSLDPTFGSGGVAILTGRYMTDGGLAWVRNRDIAVQPDGKIVVAGEAHYFSVHCDGFVARYHPNGSLDTSFGGHAPGTARVDVNVNDTFHAVALQADGKIVAVGSSDTGTSSATTDFLLARFNPNGSLDASYDGDGKVLTNFANSHYDAAYNLVIQADGKVVAVGETITSGTGSDFGIARYNLNGSLDGTFGGGDGLANIDFLNYRDYCNGVAVQSDGKIILSGYADAQISSGFGVVKLNAGGTFDTGFGGGSGRVRTLFGDAVGSALDPAPAGMALQANGKIVVVGGINFNSTGRDMVAVRYENNNISCAYALDPPAASFAAGGGVGSFNVAAAPGCEWAATSNVSWLGVTSGASGGGNGTVAFAVAANPGAQRAGTLTVAGQIFTVTQQESLVPVLHFDQPAYSVGEGGGGAAITVRRAGGSTAAVSVDYRTRDADAFVNGCAETVNNQGAAYARCDFATVVGTLSFAAGEIAKAFNVPIINDGHVEGAETFQVILSNPAGATLGTPNAVVVTVQDNDVAGAANPIFTTPFFVRQQYLDFLSREPEAGEPWSGVLNNCPNVNDNPACDRIVVSQSFFGSPEFRLKGFFVYTFYKAALGRRPEYAEIIPDMSSVTGATPAETFAKRAAFPVTFTQRQEFKNLYDGLSHTQYVNALFDRYGLQQITTPDPQQPEGGAAVVLTRADIIGRLGAAGAQALTRAQVLRAVVESSEVAAVEYNGAFVAMQYYGYLRRTPEESGYQAWLRVLNQDPNNIRVMVNGFMNSGEYRLRFGRP